jgi:hypothetical protein
MLFQETCQYHKLTFPHDSFVTPMRLNFCHYLLKQLITLRLAVYRQSIRLGAKPLETRSVKLLLDFASTIIHDFSILVIYDQDFSPRHERISKWDLLFNEGRLLLLQYHVQLNLSGLGLLLSVYCAILLFSHHILKEF